MTILNLTKFWMLSLLLVFAACADAPESDDAEVADAREEQQISETAAIYEVIPAQSQVEWIGTKTNGRHNGHLAVKGGTIAIENGEVTGGNFTLDMTTIKATDTKLTEQKNLDLTNHLKSPDFFEVKEYPEASFVITSVERISAGETIGQDTDNTEEIDRYRVTNPTHKVTGNLTLKGVTKSISFPAKIDMNNDTFEAMAKFNINRKDFDIKYELMGEAILSDIIHLGIGLKARKQNQAI